MQPCKNLDEVRENIDRIDQEIVKLIAERSSYVRQAAGFKKDEDAVKAPDRVEAIIKKVRGLAVEREVNPDLIEQVYRTMISCFIELEMKEYQQSSVSYKEKLEKE
ncbi:MAG: chorismate mutase [Clostridia bacterium]|nr:chorismate mutase [Clostridia bacterium]